MPAIILENMFFTANPVNLDPRLRIPTKPAMHSNRNPATCSDLKPARVPI